MAEKYDVELAFAKKLAQEARVIALKYYKATPETTTKTDGTPVTVADEAINTLVIERVRAAFPEHGILGEEDSFEPERLMLWVCDPIDGTIAFAMGDPVFSFALALVKDGEVVLAVVCTMENGEMFWATKGGGSFRNGEPMHVSSRSLSEAWVSFTTNIKQLFEYQDLYQTLHAQAAQSSAIHGAIFKGTLIAQGLCDGYIHPVSNHPWDAATTKLLVEEAGGLATSLQGESELFNNELTSFVVSNGVIHDDLLRIARENIQRP